MDEPSRNSVCGLEILVVLCPDVTHNPRLPNAPTTKFYCVYGHGKETEVCSPLCERSQMF